MCRFAGMRGTAGFELPVLWYETANGVRHVPEFTREDGHPPGPEFAYMHSRFPATLHDGVLLLHFGPDGRTRRSERLIEGSSTYQARLVLGLTRPTIGERLLAILRYGSPGPRLTFDQAVLRAAGCQRCMNVLAHRCGLPWGYRQGSAKDTSETSCEGCHYGGDVLA